MASNKKKKPFLSAPVKFFLILLLLPVAVTVYFFAYLAWDELKQVPFIEQIVQHNEQNAIQENFDIPIPEQYIPIYMEAGKKYNVPWTLLAAHHRIETRFSTMKSLISPVGAEGHLQFMPCTFVGWSYPTCAGLGKGDIPEEEKTNPAVIQKYGGYGVDADGDGIADPFNIYDAIYSAAHYLAKSGAANGDLKKAIYHYNHSEQYVEDVYYFYEQYTSEQQQLEKLVYNN